ncbi:MAG: hypothetical protein IPJ20_23870 [Flammeovirgaceae bacterium]|nr:hypothetical protein [Flammeovirgaceae bacterium]
MGIRVMAVAPGYTETESTKEALSEAVLQEIVKKVPLRRLGKPSGDRARCYQRDRK